MLLLFFWANLKMTVEETKQEETKQEEIMTVFNDPINFNVKHPLQDRWTFWFDNPAKRATSKDWGDNLKAVITVDSVEDFWG